MNENRRDPENDKLHTVPLEALDLSDVAIRELHRLGMTSVRDCLDFLERGSGNGGAYRAEFFDAMYGEVVEKLKKHGYLPEDAAF